MTQWATHVSGELIEAFPDLKFGRWNCRHISGSSTWSQHAWGNGLDLTHGDYGYSTKPEHQAYLDKVNRWIETYSEELSIRTRLWRVRAHFDHIHIDGWPKGYGTPPCAGGVERMQYNNGLVTYGDPGPANGFIELPDKELVTMGEAQVLKKNDAGMAVANVQRLLARQGYDIGDWPPIADNYPPGADGQYGDDTVTAVSKFQEDSDLKVTGMVDGLTLHFLDWGSPDHDHPKLATYKWTKEYVAGELTKVVSKGETVTIKGRDGA